MHALMRRQLRKAFPDGAPASPGLDALVAAVGAAYADADADRQQLERSIELASAELEQRNQALEAKVAELTRVERALAARSHELDCANRAMARILDNAAQGFVTVALDGTVVGTPSRAARAWFGEPATGTRVWTYLLADQPDVGAWMQLGFDSLAADLMPLDLVVMQLPAEMVRGDRRLRLEYRPIGEPARQLLIVVADVTETLAHRAREAAQRELIAMVERAGHDRPGFLAFVREVEALVARCADPATDLDGFRRALHTLKGTFGLFELESLAASCHALENRLADGDGPCDRTGFAPIAAAWQTLGEQLDTLLGHRRRTVVVDWDEYQAALATAGDSRSPLAARVRRWGQDPTRGHLERFAEQAVHLARVLDRAELDIAIDDQDVALEADRFAPLWGALVHTVRNAIDHGIETADERRAAGKPARARLTLRTARLGDMVAVEIADDGAGIDWAAVARRAAAMGLRHTTPRDLHEALFVDGLSTADAVTSISGRGVGMSALRAVCTDLGGEVELASVRGRGTSVRCLVPLSRSTLTVRVPTLRP